jgi:putative ABC transport system permease protein
LQLLGIDIFAEGEFRTFTAPRDMSADITGNGDASAVGAVELAKGFLTGTGSVMLSTDVASRHGLIPGDSFELSAGGKSYPASLLATFNGGEEGRLSNVIVADIGVAQRWLDMAGRLSRIDVRIEDEQGRLEEQLREWLPEDSSLVSSAGRTQTTIEMSDAFMTNLTAMSLLAMLVGIFLIYNSVAFSVLQRRDLFGVLHALGVTRSETLRLVLIEAAVLGAIGAIAGITVGTVLGEKLLALVARTVSDHYFYVNVTAVSISSWSLAKGLIAGIGATLIAATIPAVEATSCEPRLALSRSSLESSALSVVPKLCLTGIAMIAVAYLVLRSFGGSLIAGLVALFILILGFGFCIPWFAGKCSRWLGPLFGRVGGTAGRLAVEGIGRSLSRTGVAIVALAVAVSATIGVSVMVGSFRHSVSDWLETTLQSDIYVGVPGGSLDAELIDEIGAVAGVHSFSTSTRGWIESESGRTRVIALRMAPGSYAGTRIRDVDSETAWEKFDEHGAVLVSDAYAYRNNVVPGSQLELKGREGPIALEVAGVYQSYDSNNGAIMMSRDTYLGLFDDDQVDSMGLYLDPNVESETVMERIRAISAGRQSLVMSGNIGIREMSMAIFDRTFVITNVLYWLAVGVAAIGILGAMMALQLERTREFGILRAIGMTPVQTGALVSSQSGIIGLIAGLAAIPLGLVMAWVLVEVINRRAFGWQIDMVVASGPLIAALGLSVGAALIAGIYPSLHAANIRPALAMREE